MYFERVSAPHPGAPEQSGTCVFSKLRVTELHVVASAAPSANRHSQPHERQHATLQPTSDQTLIFSASQVKVLSMHPVPFKNGRGLRPRMSTPRAGEPATAGEQLEAYAAPGRTHHGRQVPKRIPPMWSCSLKPVAMSCALINDTC